MLVSDIIIVLSRPGEAGNVGAVCRVMKNMGLSRLRIATPEFDYKETQGVLLARAIHAADVWENAQTFDTLAEAVRDCAIVIGTTCRRGRHRKQVSMTPAELAAFLKEKPGPAALVFGNERAGLDNEEIVLCNFASHIPANEAFPSLNLSHAVLVYAYELFNNLANPKAELVKGQWVPLDQEAQLKLVREVTDNLKKLGFYKQAAKEEQERFFRDIFSRAALTEKESRYFSDIIAKAVRLALFPKSSNL